MQRCGPTSVLLLLPLSLLLALLLRAGERQEPSGGT